MPTSAHVHDSIAGRVSRQTKVLAALIATILLLAAFAAVDRSSTPRQPLHYLGIHGMELAAFNGSAQIYLRVTAPTTADETNGQALTPTTPGPDHSTDIACRAMSLDIENPNLGGTSTGAGAGKANFNPITLECPLSAYTTSLTRTMIAGTTYKTMNVFLVHKVNGPSGTSVQEFLTFNFKTVAIKKVSFDVESGEPSAATLTFLYGSMAIRYNRGATKTQTPTIEPSWSVTPASPVG